MTTLPTGREPRPKAWVSDRFCRRGLDAWYGEAV